MRVLHQKIHHHLKLQHHQHTGKVLHHRHTSYRGLAVVFAFAGLAMVAVTVAGRVAADSLVSVQAMVAPPVPTAAAIITQPADGAKLTKSSLLVLGSCPIVSPQVVVQIVVDDSSVGSAVCDSNNDFSLPITLSGGAHTLVTKTYTIISRPGPIGTPVHITAPTSTASKTSPSPVALYTSTPLSYLGDDRAASWTGTVSGGTPPYHIHIDWDDGKQDNITSNSGNQSFGHAYIRLASYNALITVADSAGHATSQQFAVGAYTLAAAKTSLTAYRTSVVTPATLFGLYGMFLTAVSVSGIVWVEAKHTARHRVALSQA